MHALLLTILAMTLTPAAALDRLLAAPHGLNPALVAQAEAACAHSSGFQLVDRWADFALLGKSPLEEFKARNAFVMLTTVCGPKGVDLAVKKLRDARKARDTAWAQSLARVDPKKPRPDTKATELFRFVERLVTIERQGMQMFGAAHNDALVQDLLPRVQSDTFLQLAMIASFSQVAAGDPAVKQELTKLKKNTKSAELIAAIDAWFKL